MQRFFLKKNIKLSLRAVFIEHRKGLITLSNLERKCIRNNQTNIYVKYLSLLVGDDLEWLQNLEL